MLATKRVIGGSFEVIELRIGANGEIVEIKFEKHGACCPPLCHGYNIYHDMRLFEKLK
jgi:hypothetical protein